MIFKWTYLPPLLIYLSAGVSGITGIVGVFFLKDYLNLSASFIASIGFWAGLPWALKMPVGFLVDKFWNSKNYLVYLGALIIFISLFIMYLLIVDRKAMEIYLSAEIWFIISALLTPIGYVIQDVVADAMTVEAVENKNTKNKNRKFLKKEHTLLQLYGRVAIILGTLLVGLLNVLMFSDAKELGKNQIADIYASIYFISLFIPLLSISGVLLSYALKINTFLIKRASDQEKKLEYKVFLISIFFVIVTIFLGTITMPFSQEIVLFTSLLLIGILMNYLIKSLNPGQRNSIIGTAIIIFIYRAMPSPGVGNVWFEIDILNFDQSFLSILTVNSTFITLIFLLLLKNKIVNISIPKFFIILSIISSSLYLPNLFLYYNLHQFTSNYTNGIVDERFIAFINTAVESPINQIAMIPLLAWIAYNAPLKYKATYFAVFASFTNLALSTRELFTKYLNKIFIIKREVIDQNTNEILVQADYSKLEEILISVIFITLIVPILTILIVQKTKIKSTS